MNGWNSLIQQTRGLFCAARTGRFQSDGGSRQMCILVTSGWCCWRMSTFPARYFWSAGVVEEFQVDCSIHPSIHPTFQIHLNKSSSFFKNWHLSCWSHGDFLRGLLTSEAAANHVPGSPLCRNVTSSLWSVCCVLCGCTVVVLPQKIKLSPTRVDFLIFWTSSHVGLCVPSGFNFASISLQLLSHFASGASLLVIVETKCVLNLVLLNLWRFIRVMRAGWCVCGSKVGQNRPAPASCQSPRRPSVRRLKCRTAHMNQATVWSWILKKVKRETKGFVSFIYCLLWALHVLQ